MTNTDLRCLSDADLQSLIDRATNEKGDRLKRKRADAEKNFWEAARALYKADPWFEFCTLFDDGANLTLEMLLDDAGKM